ncbi:MAG TPA: hypothetical protein VF981_01100 [Gemmatimonadaceae bacterium]
MRSMQAEGRAEDGESGTGARGEGSRTERRQNTLFRSLIEDMMAQVRELRAHSGPWPADERARAEADLERIMSRVKAEALRSAE